MPCAAMAFPGGALIASQAAKLGLWLSFVAEFIMLAAGFAVRRIDGAGTYANAWRMHGSLEHR